MSAHAVQDIILAIGGAWGLYLFISAVRDVRRRRRRPWWRSERKVW